ncbi:hypothetical protein [Streptomyces sp. NPDC085540]|uniref:hypothetical protein n=1 Tax=Streptomyces sp. NPDC085540 TaxID=3365730 RepID=UPI0037D915CA
MVNASAAVESARFDRGLLFDVTPKWDAGGVAGRGLRLGRSGRNKAGRVAVLL